MKRIFAAILLLIAPGLAFAAPALAFLSPLLSWPAMALRFFMALPNWAKTAIIAAAVVALAWLFGAHHGRKAEVARQKIETQHVITRIEKAKSDAQAAIPPVFPMPPAGGAPRDPADPRGKPCRVYDANDRDCAAAGRHLPALRLPDHLFGHR